MIARLNREEGVSFLVIEHNMDLVAGLCNPVLVMAEGRLLTQGAPDVVLSDPRVVEAYERGRTVKVRGSYDTDDARQAALERAVLKLLAA